MSSVTMIDIDWEVKFNPVYGSAIELPANVLLYRGYDTKFPIIGTRTSYYSSYSVAKGYAEQSSSTVLGLFTTTKKLKILDYRFMIDILRRCIQINIDDKKYTDYIPLIISFGLCSYRHQINLMKERYRNTISSGTSISHDTIRRIKNMESYLSNDNLKEQSGIRVAETINDGFSMALLKELFFGNFDGFISPRLMTPYHNDNNNTLSPELILFNPQDAQLIQLYTKPSSIITLKWADFIKDKQLIELLHPFSKKIDFYMSGGNKYTIHRLNEYDKLFHTNKYIQKEEKRMQNAGKRLKKYILPNIKSKNILSHTRKRK